MKTSEILIKAGQIYIEAGKKIAEAEKILNSISASGISRETKKTKPQTRLKKNKKTKSVSPSKDDMGMRILGKLNEFAEKTEKIAKDLTGK